MFGDIEEDVLLTWMIDFQGVVARKNFLSCSAQLIALKWNWALWDAGCDFSWFCTGVYFGRNPDLEVQSGRQGCILLPCLGKAQLAGGVYVSLAVLRCIVDGTRQAVFPWWLPCKHWAPTLAAAAEDTQVTSLMPGWSPNSTVLHLDIYLCKCTNLKTQQGSLLIHVGMVQFERILLVIVMIKVTMMRTVKACNVMPWWQ